jgi:hypothetical protein
VETETSVGKRPSQLVSDVQQVVDVCGRVALEELEVRGEISGQEPPSDEYQHRAADPQQGSLHPGQENFSLACIKMHLAAWN